MKKLRVGVLDLLTNRTDLGWFEARVLVPNFASIMPQCVGVWAEELGCDVFYDTYTGTENLDDTLPRDLDIVFFSAFSRSSFLAYSLSSVYRRSGAITVLGGPHALSFGEHAKGCFDYVCQVTDKATITDLLKDFSHNEVGIILNAKAHPTTLPGVQSRSRFIERNLSKNIARRHFRTIPMIGSLGCPYTCNFCVDAATPYQTFPYDQLKEDLRFTRERYGENTTVFWHDPNFGVRFKDYMGLIESSGTGLMHGGESSLSILTEENLKAMQRNRWVVQVPGIESWYDFGNKGATNRQSGLEKVRSVADHVNMLLAYIPYVQTNFVFGLDSDAGIEPFELTKKFVDLAPGTFPGFSLITDFQNSPLSHEWHRDGRTFPVPFPFLDNTMALNVRLKNYELPAFYDHLIDMQKHSWGMGAVSRRFIANRRIESKLANLGRGFSEGYWRWGQYIESRQNMRTDPNYLRMYRGQQTESPQHFFDVIKGMLGKYWDTLDPDLKTPAGFCRSVEGLARNSVAVPAAGVAPRKAVLIDLKAVSAERQRLAQV